MNNYKSYGRNYWHASIRAFEIDDKLYVMNPLSNWKNMFFPFLFFKLNYKAALVSPDQYEHVKKILKKDTSKWNGSIFDVLLCVFEINFIYLETSLVYSYILEKIHFENAYISPIFLLTLGLIFSTVFNYIVIWIQISRFKLSRTQFKYKVSFKVHSHDFTDRNPNVIFICILILIIMVYWDTIYYNELGSMVRSFGILGLAIANISYLSVIDPNKIDLFISDVNYRLLY